MPEAIICLKTNLNSSKEILEELRNCAEVKEAFKVIGEYDIIAKVVAAPFEDLIKLDQYLKRRTNVQEILSMLLLEPKKMVHEEVNGVLFL